MKRTPDKISEIVAPHERKIFRVLAGIRCIAFVIAVLCVAALVALLFFSKGDVDDAEVIERVKSGYCCISCVAGAFVFGCAALMIFLIETESRLQYVLNVIYELIEEYHGSDSTLTADETDSDEHGQEIDNLITELANVTESQSDLPKNNSDLTKITEDVKSIAEKLARILKTPASQSTVQTPEKCEAPVKETEKKESSAE